jgi:hypothetical protein
MTAYWDRMEGEATASGIKCSDEEFIARIAEVEEMVMPVVLLNTGDREFPNDLRGEIIDNIALKTVGNMSKDGRLLPLQKAVDRVARTGRSWLIWNLHDLFHELARRDIKTRFGTWTDDPEANLKRRDEKDAE